jgi:hypothetical protein
MDRKAIVEKAVNGFRNHPDWPVFGRMNEALDSVDHFKLYAVYEAAKGFIDLYFADKDSMASWDAEILESISYFKLLEVYEATKKYHDLKTAYENEAQAFYDGHTDFFPSDLEEHMKEAHEKLLDLILKKP